VSTLTGTWTLTRLGLRRDRIMLVIWVYAFTAFVAATVVGFRKLAPTRAARSAFAATAAHNPAFLSLYGRLYGSSLGSLTAWRDASITGLFAGLVSVFLVIRHTRADEETGRLELIGSAVVGRRAPLASALILAWLANLITVVTMTAVAAGLGLPLAGSLALAAGIAGAGIVFAAVAAATAQLAQSARAARGLAIGVLGVAFVFRAVGDSASGSGPRWLSWLSPFGWSGLNQAFGATIRWWVLALPVVLAALVTAAAAGLAAHRDYDAGLLASRPGPAAAAGSLRSPLALAWRLQRVTLLGWTTGALVYGLVIGSSAKGIGGVLGSADLRRIMARLGGSAGLTNEYLAALLSFTALVAAGYAVSAVLRLRTEETSGRAEPVLATGASRVAWGASHLLIAAAGTAVIMAVVGFGVGLSYASRAGGGAEEVGRLFAAGLAQVPPVLVLGGLAAAVFGLAPRLSSGVSWTVLGVVVALMLLGATAGLSHWVLDVSPFTQVPRLPGGTVSALPIVVLCGLALALAGAGLAGLRRRDIG
jgi:ABC-2 type transport system permease protein